MSKLTHRLAALFALAAVLFTGLAAQAARVMPKGCQRVQFVELTDGAVVQTDVHVEETMSLYFKFAMNYKSAYGAAITDYLGEDNRLTCVRYSNTTKTTYLVSFMNKTNGGGTSMKLTTADGQIIEGEMSAGTASINNVTAELRETSYKNPTDNPNCLLLKDTGAGSTFYYFTVSNTVTDANSGDSTTTLVRDYIPCVQLATGKAGFWNGDEFQTSETGTVTAGDYVVDPATDCMVSGYPAEYATDETPVFYGVIAGLAGETYTAPATMPFNNGTRTCTGYKLYEYQDGAYVEIASDSATTYTFTAADAAASNRKLVWQWQTAETYTASSYAAADVLVSQWDAIDNQATGTHDPSATDWKALKGGVNFALTGTAWTENGLSFSGDAESYALALSTAEGFAEAFPSGAKTVEIVVNPKTVAGYALCGSMCGLYFNGTTSVIPTVKPGTTKGVTYAKAAANVTCTYSTLYTAADLSSALRLNGTTAATGTTGYSNVSPTDVCLGGNGAGGFNGSVYSLRIYNRTLSEDEAVYNAAVDNIRFKGADPDEEIHALGIRLRQDGLFEYLLSVDAGVDGKVKVTANGETTAASELAELWLTNGAPVKVEYVPTTAGDWRYLEGCPDDVAYVSPTVTTFTMPDEKLSVTEIPYPYSDENVFSSTAPTSVETNHDALVVYGFATPTLAYPVFAKKPITLEERDGSCRAVGIDEQFQITPSGPTSISFSVGDNTSRRFAFAAFDSYPILSGEATPEPVITLNGTQLVKDADYVLHYENATEPGAATMVVVGKSGTALEGLAQRYGFAAVYVRCVTPSGTGDGSDWEHPMGLADAVAGLANGSYEIWCASGTYEFSAALTIPIYTTIRGGFAADPADILKKDPDGKKTAFDGGETTANLFNVTYNCPVASFATQPVIFKDCIFTRCAGTAVMRAKLSGNSTSLSFANCDFLGNKAGSTDGIACYIYNANNTTPVNFTNCRFEGNVNTVATKSLIYLYAAKLSMDGCTFVTNGAPLTSTRTNFSINSLSTKLVSINGSQSSLSKITNCDFRGNFFARYTVASMIVHISNAKVSISSCRFVGNSIYATKNYSTQQDAVVRVEGGSASTPLTIKNCTFAYNVIDAVSNPSSCVRSLDGISPIVIESCVFWQNRLNDSNSGTQDFGGTSNATITYCNFAALEPGICVSFEPGEGCFTDDPLFVTTNSVDDYILTSSGRIGLDPAKIDDILAIDVHLLSSEGYRKNGDATWYKADGVVSSAIDAGNPEADFSLEPGRNGSRLNAGAYGNTDEASQTPFSDPEIVSVSVDFPDGLTQPRLTMEVGGEGVFVGSVVFYYSTDGGKTYVASDIVGGAAKGGSVSWFAPLYVKPGDTFKYYAELSAPGATTKMSSPAQVTATGAKPPWENPGDVVLVTPEGTPEGSGQAWTNALDLATALEELIKRPNTEIWLKADTFVLTNGTLDITSPVRIRGGFAADDPTNLGKRTANDAKTVFDGAGVATRFFNSLYNCAEADFATRPVIFTDCVFTRCAGTAVYSDGRSTPFTFVDCAFVTNHINSTASGNIGIAIYANSSLSAPVTFKNCTFRRNTRVGSGAVSSLIWAGTAVKLTLDDCTFEENGVNAEELHTISWTSGSTSLVFMNGNGASTIRNCVFRGNFLRKNYGYMQILRIYGKCQVAVENCVFVGNSFLGSNYTQNTVENGDIYIALTAGASYWAKILNCTFAYNALDNNAKGSSAIYGGNDQTSIENCIFWGNRDRADNISCRDLEVSTAASVRYCFFEDLTQGLYVNIALDDTNLAGDPLFVSGDVMDSLLRTDTGASVVLDGATKLDEILALDVHLRSTEGYRKNGDATWYKTENELSPAIDTGDPEADFSKEPGKNGERLNMGAYGNTDEASQTPYANPALGEPTVVFEGPYTQPTVTLAMGGDGQFNVTVTVFASADGVNWTSSANFSMANGDSVSWLVPEYFPVDGKVYLKTSYDFQGATIEDESYESTDVEGTLPPWYGKGGDPAKIVHVRAGATGKGDGTSWTDAYTDMGAAMRGLSSTRNEMWIAGTAEMVEADNPTVWENNYTMFFRGGFTGIENTPEQRTDQLATSTITGGGVNDGLKFNSASAKIFENIAFEGGSIYGLKLQGGRAAFTNCVFCGNGTSPTLAGYQGRVLNATTVSPLQMKGCTFAENLVTNQWKTPGGKQGHLFSFDNTDVYLDDCLFVSNGLKKSMFVWTNEFATAKGGESYCPGFLIGFTGNYKSFVANNTRFIANTSLGGGNYGGGVIEFEDTGTHVAFTNCLFLANELVQNPLGTAASGDPGDLIFFGSGSGSSSTSPIIDVINCTFAFNSTYRANGGAALTVKALGSPMTRVKNSIFLANRTSNGCGWRQLEITTGTAEVDYCCFDSTNGFHGVGYDAVTNAANHNLVAVDPMTYSTVTDFTNALSTAYSIHFDWEHPEKFMNFNVHLRGRGGYIDETTGQKVAGEGKPSPCVDAGDPKSDYRRETKPRGYRVNMGFYGNTPYQTQTLSGGVFSVR